MTTPSGPTVLFLFLWDCWKGTFILKGVLLTHPTLLSSTLTLGCIGFSVYYVIYLLPLGDAFQEAWSERIGTSNLFNSVSKPLGASARFAIPGWFSNPEAHVSALSVIHSFHLMNASTDHCIRAKTTHPLDTRC